MTTTLDRTPARLGPANGGPARRALVRWAWRLFRREWRQQVLVPALLAVAVAATTAAVSVATNAVEPEEATFVLPASNPNLAADIAAFEQAFGAVDVVAHQRIAVPGSVDTIDLRAQDPNRATGQPTLRLLAGRYRAARPRSPSPAGSPSCSSSGWAGRGTRAAGPARSWDWWRTLSTSTSGSRWWPPARPTRPRS